MTGPAAPATGKLATEQWAISGARTRRFWADFGLTEWQKAKRDGREPPPEPPHHYRTCQDEFCPAGGLPGLLEEALAHGPDPLHLAVVFGLDPKTAIRYAENARLLLTTAAEEQDPADSREPKGQNHS